MITPSLEKLKTQPCSPEEVQAALVELIELYNKLVKKIDTLEENGRIMSSQEARAGRKYGL